MTKKRSIGVTIFAMLLLVPLVYITITYINEARYWGAIKLLPVYAWNFLIGIALVFLSVGIFKLKNWARLICVWGSAAFFAISWLCGLTGLNPLGLIGLAHI